MRTAGFPEEIRLRQCHGQTDNGVTDSVQEDMTVSFQGFQNKNLSVKTGSPCPYLLLPSGIHFP